ncbi:MAG: class I SAM-dependent methyltransferase [Betaproteobacteria bacterium]|nr:class I SAM-dependent methyltransferase [Betaproteobacteria bacterium]
MSSDSKADLSAARAHLEAGRRDLAAELLDAALRSNPADVEAHNLREAHRLPGCYSDWVGVYAGIHPDDDIFRFFARHPQSRNPVRDYLSDGWRSALELHRLVNSLGRPLHRMQSFLEFACGHGRLTRHLVHDMKPEHITVSDVVPGTVDFLRQQLGVHGFYSSSKPQELMAPARYDMIFVLSMFTHLPKRTWGAWLSTLHALLAPGGCLIISTHGEKCAQDAGVQWDGEGYAFFPDSESSALGADEYGVTYTSRDFVQRAIAEHLPAAVRVSHHPAHFWGNQDAVAIERL